MNTAKKLTAPLKWHGGKAYLASKIIALMPPRCKKPNAPAPAKGEQLFAGVEWTDGYGDYGPRLSFVDAAVLNLKSMAANQVPTAGC